MRPILIAAGRGQRLGQETDARPKSLVPVLGRPIIEWILEAFQTAGFERRQVVCVCGYRDDLLRERYPEFTFVHNADWQNNNVLLSLMHARPYLNEGFISTYTDIVYENDAIQRLLKSPHSTTLLADTDWRRRYVGRTLHPESDAEKLTAEGDRVLAISRTLAPSDASGEFTGILQVKSDAVPAFVTAFDRAQAQFAGKPWREGRTFERAYLIDLLQHLIENQFPIHQLPLGGGYMELDTPQDLAFAESWWANRLGSVASTDSRL